jgi:hypothetical protein
LITRNVSQQWLLNYILDLVQFSSGALATEEAMVLVAFAARKGAMSIPGLEQACPCEGDHPGVPDLTSRSRSRGDEARGTKAGVFEGGPVFGPKATEKGEPSNLILVLVGMAAAKRVLQWVDAATLKPVVDSRDVSCRSRVAFAEFRKEVASPFFGNLVVGACHVMTLIVIMEAILGARFPAGLVLLCSREKAVNEFEEMQMVTRVASSGSTRPRLVFADFRPIIQKRRGSVGVRFVVPCDSAPLMLSWPRVEGRNGT